MTLPRSKWTEDGVAWRTVCAVILGIALWSCTPQLTAQSNGTTWTLVKVERIVKLDRNVGTSSEHYDANGGSVDININGAIYNGYCAGGSETIHFEWRFPQGVDRIANGEKRPLVFSARLLNARKPCVGYLGEGSGMAFVPSDAAWSENLTSANHDQIDVYRVGGNLQASTKDRSPDSGAFGFASSPNKQDSPYTYFAINIAARFGGNIYYLYTFSRKQDASSLPPSQTAPPPMAHTGPTAQTMACGVGNQWSETESGFNALWQRESADGRFVAYYTAPDGHRATTHNRVSLYGTTVSIGRLDSTDGVICNYRGTLSGTSISGSYSCPRDWAGERPWSATVVCSGAVPTPTAQPPAPVDRQPPTTAPGPTNPGTDVGNLSAAMDNDPSLASAGSDASAIALLVLLRVQLGQIAPGNAASTAVNQEAKAVHSGVAPNLRRELNQAGLDYINLVADKILRAAKVSGGESVGGPAAIAASELRIAHDEFVAEMGQGTVPVQAIVQAGKALEDVPGQANGGHFNSHRALTEQAARILIDKPAPRRPIQ